MITVHHLENSRSQRILWLLEELGVDYEIKHYARDKKTSLAPPELLNVHPLGKSPVITDGDTTVAESGAIIEYLVNNYDDGRLLPVKGTQERLAYTYWLHYAEGTFMPLMILSLIMGRIESAPMPFFINLVHHGAHRRHREGPRQSGVGDRRCRPVRGQRGLCRGHHGGDEGTWPVRGYGQRAWRRLRHGPPDRFVGVTHHLHPDRRHAKIRRDQGRCLVVHRRRRGHRVRHRTRGLTARAVP